MTQINDAVDEVNESSKEMMRRYRKEMMLRKKYHNQLVELRGEWGADGMKGFKLV